MRSLLASAVLLCPFAAPVLFADEPTPVPPAARDLVSTVEASVVVIKTNEGLGSGFLVDDGSFVITNYHVIEGAKTATVVFRDKSEIPITGVAAFVAGKDVAILRIASDRKRPTLLLAELPEKGVKVYAFGAPLGLAGSVTDGIVSAVRSGDELRDLRDEASGIKVYDALGYDQDATWIQTTAHINHGNSGGPLTTEAGTVVGINTWTQLDAQNLNFAISSRDIRSALSRADTTPPLSLDKLPPPRKGAARATAPASGEKTLACWKRIGEINQEMRVNLGRVRSIAKNATSASKLAKAHEQYVKDLQAESLNGVDMQLAIAVTVDAKNAEYAAHSLRKQVVNLRSNANDPTPLMEVKGNAFVNDQVNLAYDVLRMKLTERYNLEFPAIYRDVTGLKKPTPPTTEQRDRSQLGFIENAKRLWDLGTPQSRSAAVSRLQKVAQDNNGTDIGDKAQRLLEDLRKTSTTADSKASSK